MWNDYPRETYKEGIVDEEYEKLRHFLATQEKKWFRSKMQRAVAKAKYRFWMDQHNAFLGRPYRAYDY